MVKVPPNVLLESLVQLVDYNGELEVERLLLMVRSNNEDPTEDEVLVKWKGCPLSSATFEPRENVEHLLDNYPDLLDATMVGKVRVETLARVFKVVGPFLEAVAAAVLDREEAVPEESDESSSESEEASDQANDMEGYGYESPSEAEGAGELELSLNDSGEDETQSSKRKFSSLSANKAEHYYKNRYFILLEN